MVALHTRTSRKSGFLVVIGTLVALFFGLSATHAGANSSNLIVNPGFEDGLEGWHRGFGAAGVEHSIDDSEFHTGSASLRLSSDNPDYRGAIYQDVFGFEPGARYKLEWRRKMESVHVPGPWGAFLRMSIFNEDGLIGNSHYIGRQEEGTRSWEPFEYVFDVPADAIRIRVELFLDRATGTVWWDSLSLIQAETPEAPKPAPSPSAYGAEVNPTGNPIGGGVGYSDILTEGDFTVETVDELLSALKEAEAGEVVYIVPDAEIDLTGLKGLRIPPYVTLAGNRGLDGAPGPLLFSDEMDTYPLFEMGEGARMTGIRLRGPDGTTQDSAYGEPNSLAVRTAGNRVKVDNNEIFNWSYAGVSVGHQDAHIHHNTIHHVQRTGLGYPVTVGAGGTALIEANYFDWYRHAIASSGMIGAGYEARYNIAGENATSFAFDMHGGRDFCPKRSTPCSETERYMGGEWIHIHHNTFLNTRQRAIGIRGVPLQGGSIHNNWFMHTDMDYAVGILTYMGNVEIFDNVYGPERLLAPSQLEKSPLVVQCPSWCPLDTTRLPVVAVVDPLKISFVHPAPARPNESAFRAIGRLPVDVEVEVGSYLNVREVRITFGEEVIYSGPNPPQTGEVSVDTTQFEDGVYRLALSVYDPDRGTVVTERMIRVSNWWQTIDRFEPPREAGWFGTIDLSRTLEESSGWTYATEHADNFFGDATRKVRKADTSEYLIWEASRLQDFEIVAYVKEDVALEAMLRAHIEVDMSDEDGQWLPLDFSVAQESGDGPWVRTVIKGHTHRDVEDATFRLLVKEGWPADAFVLGEVTLKGYVPFD